MENKEICYECGKKFDTTDGDYIKSGEFVCFECLEDNYFRCDCCNEIVPCDEEYYITDTEEYYITDTGERVCGDCIERYYHCEDCGEWFADDPIDVENHGIICHNCYNNGDYGYCEDCGNCYRGSELRYHNTDNCYYCENCFEDHSQLYDYHEFSNWNFYKGEKDKQDPQYYIGKEIELEPLENHRPSENDVLNIIDRNINGVGMHDGSLCRGGVEVVTHPESWNYLLENKGSYKQFFKEIEALGYGDRGHSGLHFHISRPSDDVVSRIIVILESFKDEIKKLSRRNGNYDWCKFLTDGRDKMQNIKYQSSKYLKEKYTKECHDRYLALNLCNYNTIEFRFFNGANNFEEFWGALQFIHNIMEIALDETRELNTINWKDLIIGIELEEQAKKQGVYGIDKFAKDTTQLIENIEKAREEMVKEIQRTLKNFVKYISKELEEKKLTITNRNDVLDIERNGQDYLNSLTNDMNYLHRLTNLYYNINSNDLDTTKYSIETIKGYTRSMDKYSRYFKQMDKSIKKFESEVLV